MKNNSPDYYFKKIVTIINTSQNLDTSLAHGNTKYAAQFFPEGGNLVNELDSTIAFKVNDSYGKGVDCDGLIIDQSKDTITHFQSSRFGMGKFSFTPQTGKNYTAVIRLNDSSIITKALPSAYGNGYVMHVSDLDTRHIKISVQSSSGMPLSNVYIIAETRQHIDFAKTVPVENNHAELIFNIDSIAEGTAQITIFNQDRQPICERLWFKRPK